MIFTKFAQYMNKSFEYYSITALKGLDDENPFCKWVQEIHKEISRHL